MDLADHTVGIFLPIAICNMQHLESATVLLEIEGIVSALQH